MLSVIIPIFNAEDYLRICLNSILKQTYPDFEIICIDDASTDSSLEILKYFSKKDSRIKIFKNDSHKGFGHCKNVGLDCAKGDYISFLDSSNWYSFNAFELIVDKIRDDDLDIVLFQHADYNDESHLFSIISDEDSEFMAKHEFDVFNHWNIEKSEFFKIYQSSENKFYSRSFLNRINIKFSEDVEFNEDVPFFFKVFASADKIAVINKRIYNHRVINNSDFSLTDGMLFKNIGSIYGIFDVFLENEMLFNYYKKEVFTYIFSSLLNNQFNQVEEKYKPKFFHEIQKVYKTLVKDYGFYEEILENVDKNLLNQFKFKNIVADILADTPQISVIIPVYNVEDYLCECMESVINQSFEDIEIICVNDGSTDNSLEILNEYCKKDTRIKIINQENHGLGYARNVGLQQARGKYIFFVDSDDYILLNTLECTYNNAISNNSDLVMFKIARLNNGEISYENPGFPLENVFNDADFDYFTFNYKNIKKYVLNSSFQACSKIYKKEFLERFVDFKFAEGTAYEDVIFHVKSLLRASKISFIPEFFYVYRTSNPNSIMNSKENVFDIFKVCDGVEEFLEKSNHLKEFNLEFCMFKIRQLSQYIPLSDSKEYKNLVKEEFKSMELVDGIPDSLLKIYEDTISD